MKAKVDPDVCVGTGSCESLCPKVFKVGDSGIAEVQMDAIPPELEDEVREAAASCPVDAISIEE